MEMWKSSGDVYPPHVVRGWLNGERHPAATNPSAGHAMFQRIEQEGVVVLKE